MVQREGCFAIMMTHNDLLWTDMKKRISPSFYEEPWHIVEM